MTDDRPWADTQTHLCEECGFDPSTIPVADLPDAIRGLGRRYRAPLTRFLPGEDPDVVARTRPAPEVWSALEYACHVRDVLSVFDGRLRRMLVEDRPELGWWDHEAAVDDEAYNEQDREAVVDDLTARASSFAELLESVPDDAWDREGVRRGGAVFTVAGMGHYTLHEGSHHLLDVGRSLRAARGR